MQLHTSRGYAGNASSNACLAAALVHAGAFVESYSTRASAMSQEAKLAGSRALRGGEEGV